MYARVLYVCLAFVLEHMQGFVDAKHASCNFNSYLQVFFLLLTVNRLFACFEFFWAYVEEREGIYPNTLSPMHVRKYKWINVLT